MLRFGSKVRIKGITDADDIDLNGKTGQVSKKFYPERKHVFGDIGVWLDEPCDGTRMVNVLNRELEVVRDAA